MIPEPYFPLRSDTFGMSLGIRPLEAHERLIHTEPTRIAPELAQKHAQIATNRAEYVQLPAHTRDAQIEAAEHICIDIGLSETAALYTHPNPLEWMALRVQEDLCLMNPTRPGVPLVAGVVTFPADWTIREKVGRSFLEVHSPVPGFAAAIGPMSVNLLERLKLERPVWRPNWSGVKSTDQLDLSPTQYARIKSQTHGITVENAGERLFFRVERQTLSRLPRTQHVLFTIRTYLAPLAEVCANPLWKHNLLGWLNTAPPEWIDYKGMTPFLSQLRGYLD